VKTITALLVFGLILAPLVYWIATLTGIFTPAGLEPCDAHALPFLGHFTGTHPPDGVPAGTTDLYRIPILVAKSKLGSIERSRTGWNNAAGTDWSVGLRGSFNALSVGLDWLLLDPVLSDVSGEVTSWRPGSASTGFGALFFVEDGDFWAYGRGPDLDELFTYDTALFDEQSGLLHSKAELDSPIGGTLAGVDFNGGFYGVWPHSAKCFPRPIAPDSTEISLFYSRPGERLFTSVATKDTGGGTWTWATGTPVELTVETPAGLEPLFAPGSKADITAFSFDRANQLLLYSLADDIAPFLVASVLQELAEGAVVKELILAEP